MPEVSQLDIAIALRHLKARRDELDGNERFQIEGLIERLEMKADRILSERN